MTAPRRTEGIFRGTLALLGALLLSDCASGPDASWYRAHVATSEGREIPFFLALPADCAEGSATIVNGTERIPVPCRRIGNHLRLDFPVFGTLIEADESEAGVLSGQWCHDFPEGRTCALSFHGRPVPTSDPLSRFESSDAPASDVSGEWHFDFERRGLARGSFEQLPSAEVRGTIEVPSEYGDLRFLAGVAAREGVFLSTFDGQHAILLEGKIDLEGMLSGELVDVEGSDAFVARRSEAVALPDPRGRVKANGRASAPFLDDPRYQGNPVIVEIFGTWCPNCNDLAPVLAGLHRRYADRGLQLIGLAYEALDDPEYVERRLREYKSKHGIEWETVLAGTVEDLGGEPSWLSGIEGVPVLAFLDRNGNVRATYAGFSGPATGEAHVRAVAEIERLTSEILELP